MREAIEPSSTHTLVTVPDNHLGTVGHPEEILHHSELSTEQKRSILAAWASDAHAVEGAPALRQLESGAIVRIDDILDALRSLDGVGQKRAPRCRDSNVVALPRHCEKLLAKVRQAVRVKKRDDEDDPPPPPAAISWPLRHSFVVADALGRPAMVA